MSEPLEFNDSFCFELLDRTHIASSYVQMALGDHPVLIRHPELNAIYEQIVERIEALYQALGQIEQTWS